TTCRRFTDHDDVIRIYLRVRIISAPNAFQVIKPSIALAINGSKDYNVFGLSIFFRASRSSNGSYETHVAHHRIDTRLRNFSIDRHDLAQRLREINRNLWIANETVSQPLFYQPGNFLRSATGRVNSTRQWKGNLTSSVGLIFAVAELFNSENVDLKLVERPD